MLSPPSLFNRIPKAVIRQHSQHFTNRALLNQLPHLHTEREVPRPHSLHQKQILALCRFAQDLRLCRIDGKCLLTQYMLPGFKRQHHILEMMRVRRRDVHHVHIGVGHELLVGSVGGTGGRDTRVSDESGRTVLGRRGCDGCHGVGNI